MGDVPKKEDTESSTGVFELPGEPAIFINGVPDLPSANSNLISIASSRKHKNTGTESETSRSTGYGVWLEGREVKKLFGDQYYSGTVTEYDKKTGWYRVVYEDGDFEDLDWHELVEVLQPLHITVPLRALALKIIKKEEKTNSGSGSRAVKSGKGGRREREKPRTGSSKKS